MWKLSTVIAAVAIAGLPIESARGCAIQNGVDYYGNDLSHARARSAELCCGICQSTAGCKAFTWTGYEGGTCWLKSGVGSITANPNARSAKVEENTCGPLSTTLGMMLPMHPAATWKAAARSVRNIQVVEHTRGATTMAARAG